MRTYQVKIPAGARHGQLFRFGTANGKEVNHSSADNIFLRIRLAPHPVFRVENDALYCDLRVNAWTVLFGGTISVPTPEGAVQVNVPTGLRDGQRLRLRGYGLPVAGHSRDDLYVVVRTPAVDRP
jgi:curved DNA-binding protein